VKEYYEQVNVPKAPEEPDERIDKMTGMPYAVQAGEAFIDEEDRFGFAAGGLVTLIKRLVRGVDEVVNDARPTTRVDIDEDVTDTLREFRSQEPKNFVDPESTSFSTSKVKVDDEGNFIKYLREEEGLELEDFRYYDDQEDIIDRFKMFSSENETAKVSVLREPDERYFVAKKEIDSRIAKELDDELTRIPEEDVNFVQRYFNDIPKRTNKPTPPTASSKEDFLKGSEEQGSQFNASFFSNIKYENPLSARIPRELGLHVGTKGHAQTIQIRGAYPRGEELIEKEGVQQYIKEGLDEDSAKVAVNTRGVHDEIFDSKIKELNEFVPVGVKSIIQEGFINVKKPLVLDTDMINWNPAKFLGGADPTGNLKLKEQAQTFVDALNTQVKMDDAQFTKIVDTAALEINSFIRKKDMNSGKLLNSAYDHNINIITRKMLEDLGFDSIKYTNMGELTRVSERQAGGNSYILFRDDQFFVPPPPHMRQPRTLRETIPEVQKAYDDLKAGTITSDEYDKIVNNTVYPYENIPIPETDDAMFTALTKNQREKINAVFEEGLRVGLRLDINAYLNYDTWVPTIHVKGKSKGHQATAAIKNVDFSMTGEGQVGKLTGAEKSQEVIEGIKGKTPFAQIMGDYVNRTTDENFRLAQEALNSDEWIQVGFDPRRHSFFYDRVTGQPVATAEEVIQVGPLVLAKKATYADRSLYPYATGGRVLRSLGRTRRAEGGILGAIESGIKKGAKFLGFDDEKQLRISADATDLTKQIDPKREVTWVHQGKPITTDQLRNLKSNRDQIALSGNEELFDTVNHSLFGYETGSNPMAAVGGQLKELYQGTKEVLQGRDWRTQAKDAYNNQFGIIQRSKGLSRPEFDMEVAKAVQRTQNKLQRGEKLIFGRDVILNPYDIMRKEER